ncbi:MAG: TIM barrel protein [Chloroflexi bacterium]|nr:TIM barrel protein [Chloroflexota bacterium]
MSRYRLDASIHCPLVRPSWYPFFPTWSYLCHMDEDKRELNFRMVTDTLERADDLGAQYVIVHYPSPLPPETAALPLAELRNIALESAYRLDKLAERQRIVIHVEGFGPHPLFTPAFLVQVMETFSHLRYCFDTGHMHLAAQRDGFDYYQFAARMAPYLGSIHMWNTRSFEDYQTFRHIPLHPSQRPRPWGLRTTEKACNG